MKNPTIGRSMRRIAAVTAVIAGVLLLVSSFTAYADDAASGRLAAQGYSWKNAFWSVDWRITPRYVLLKHDPTPTAVGYFSLVVGAESGDDWKASYVMITNNFKQEDVEANYTKRVTDAFSASIAFDDGQQVRMTAPSADGLTAGTASARKPQPALGGSQGIEIRLPPEAKQIVRVEIYTYWDPIVPGTYNSIGVPNPYPPAGPAWPADRSPWVWPLNVAVAARVAPGAVPGGVAAGVGGGASDANKAAVEDTGPGSPAYEAALAAAAAALAAWAALFGLTIGSEVVPIGEDGLPLPVRPQKGTATATPPEEHWASPLPPPPTTTDAPPPPAPVGEDGLPLPEPSKVKLAPKPEHWAQPQPEPEQHWAQPQPAPTGVVGAPDAEGGRDASSNTPPAPAPAAPAKTAAQLAEEAYAQAEADAAAKRGPADPNSPAEVLKRAKAGDIDAQKQWDAMKAEGQPSFADSVIQHELDIVAPGAGAVYRQIGGAETVKELGKTDWGTEVEKSAGALKDAAVKSANESIDYVKKTVTDGVSLLKMDDEELASTWNQATKEAKESAVGKLVKQGASLTDMSLDEAVGAAKEMGSGAFGSIKQLVDGMTPEEIQAHMKDADSALHVAVQKAWQTDPEAARKFFAESSVEALKQAGLAWTGETVIGGVGKLDALASGGAKAADALVEANAARTTASELATAQKAASELVAAQKAASELSAAQRAASEASTAQKLAADASAARDASVTADTVREVKTAGGAAGEGLPAEVPPASTKPLPASEAPTVERPAVSAKGETVDLPAEPARAVDPTAPTRDLQVDPPAAAPPPAPDKPLPRDTGAPSAAHPGFAAGGENWDPDGIAIKMKTAGTSEAYKGGTAARAAGAEQYQEGLGRLKDAVARDPQYLNKISDPETANYLRTQLEHAPAPAGGLNPTPEIAVPNAPAAPSAAATAPTEATPAIRTARTEALTPTETYGRGDPHPAPADAPPSIRTAKTEPLTPTETYGPGDPHPSSGAPDHPAATPEAKPSSASGGQAAAEPKEPPVTAGDKPPAHLEDKPLIQTDHGPPITGAERQELLARANDPAHVPEVSGSDMDRYKEAVLKAREAAGGPVGACEKAQQSLVDQLGGKVAMNDGKLAGAIDHSVVVTKEGLILDPVSRQAIKEGYVTAGQVRAAGLTKAMEEGVFTPKQWAKFNSLGGRGARF